VSILSANPETLDGLQAYLVGAGLPSRCLGALEDLEKKAAEPARALIVFPDDFAHDNVLRLLRRIRQAQPHLLVLLVTREPQHFNAAVEASGRSRPPVVLARPCFGWDILDVIRTQAPTDPL
jgi:hypothetical protein